MRAHGRRLRWARLLLGSALVWALPLGAEILSLNSDAGNVRWFARTKADPVDDARVVRGGGALDATGWREVRVPGNLNDDGLEPGPRGGIWYRVEFELSAVPDERQALRLGEISDRDRTYLNGTLLGQTGQWDAERPQAYDLQRIYEIPAWLLRPGRNVLHIQVQRYFPDELGLYRDRAELGPARVLLRDFYLENLGEALTLMAYLTLGIYFLLFFLRRRQERENLYFALFLFSLCVYSFLRTQLKYELGWDLHTTKRIQTISVILALPLFYAFVRSYYKLPEGFKRYWDRVALAVHAIPAGCAVAIAATESTRLWQSLLDNVAQPGWILYVLGIMAILVHQVLQKNRDALIMLASSLVLVIALVLDILTGRALINLPTLLTYAFVLFVLSMALVLANRFVRLHTETENLNRTLSLFNDASRRFVPFEFLTILDKKSILDVELGDQVQREMTVLFSDIRSFTTLSESMNPSENFAFINSYLRRMGPVIREHGGFIDKYIGDAIMALFARDSDAALVASVQMMRTLERWNERRQVHDLPPVSIGVGLHRGQLMLGTIGENERMEGTVISDAVNLAARIEGLTKRYGAAILVSDAIRTALEKPDRFEMRFVDRVAVKGKSQSVSLYEVLDGLPAAERHARLEARASFDAAMSEYQAQNFGRATELFRALDTGTGDLAARMYVQRCEHYQKIGVPPNWDGSVSLETK